MRKAFAVGIIALIIWLLFTLMQEQDVFAALLPAKDKEQEEVPPLAPLPPQQEIPAFPGTAQVPSISVDIPMPDFGAAMPKVELGDVAAKIGLPTSLPSLATRLPTLAGLPVPVVGAIGTLAERGYYIISRTIGLIFGSSNLPESKFLEAPVTFYPIHYGMTPANVLELFRSSLIELTPEQAQMLALPIQANVSVNEYSVENLQNILASFNAADSETWGGFAPDEIREGYALEQRRLTNLSTLEAQAAQGLRTDKFVTFTTNPAYVGETETMVIIYKPELSDRRATTVFA
jgi:hypothetical protein